MAKYCNLMLNKNMDTEEISKCWNLVALTCKIIPEKHLFVEYHTQLLTSRFLKSKRINLTHEQILLLKLKVGFHEKTNL